MEKFRVFIFIFSFLSIFTFGCSNNPYFDIPTDEDGRPVLTEVSSATTTGITEDDDEFSVTATLPNALPGDVMLVDLLKPQPHEASEADQLLPLAGTRKEAVVDDNFQASVTYTKEEADMQQVGDYVEVIFNGETDSAQIRVTLRAAN